MQWKTTFLQCCLMVVGMVTTISAKADHITGGQMYYRYAGEEGGNNLYEVTLVLYMRCNSGRSFANPAVFSVFDKGNNGRIQDITVNLNKQENLSLNTNDPCISNPPFVCFEVGTYYFTVRVPPNAAGYIIAGQVNFRISGMANINSGSGNIGATYTGEIPGTVQVADGYKNSSAIFVGTDLVVVCADNEFKYSFAATDNDGDVLRYSFCDALQTNTGGGPNTQGRPPIAPPYQSVPYGGGFAGNSPLGNKVKIDPYTGLITGIAPGPGVYVVTVCVDEIRNGKVIATQRKDLQINITGCSIASASLEPEYLLCTNSTQLTVSNNSTSSLINAYYWQINNRQGNLITTSTNPQLDFNFSDTGLYAIKLYTNRGIACPDSAESLVRVYPGFLPNFSILGSCVNRPINFTDLTTTVYGNILGWRWDFGESKEFNDTSLLQNPSYAYTTLGNKKVQLLVTNSNGCKGTFERDGEIKLKSDIQLAFRDTLICPPDQFQLKANGIGQFSWQPTQGMLGANTATPFVAPQTTTTYYVQLDDQGCTNTDSVLVRVTNAVQIVPMPDTTICLTDSVVLRVQSNALRYNWQPGADFLQPTLAHPIALPKGNTTYTVTGFISQCSTSAQINVITAPYAAANAGRDTTLCFNSLFQLNGITNGVRFAWLPANQLTGAATLTPLFSATSSTNLVLSAFSGNACPKPFNDTIQITVTPPIIAFAGRDTAIVTGQLLQMQATGGIKYVWMPSTNLSNPAIANPQVRFTEPSDGQKYTVQVYNDFGCVASASVKIVVFAGGPSIFVPTGFTPNADGNNDILRPVLAGIRTLDFFNVYNRFGQLVFSTSTPGKGWDGTIQGKKQSTASFVWVAKAIDFNGNVVVKKGATTLVQ